MVGRFQAMAPHKRALAFTVLLTALLAPVAVQAARPGALDRSFGRNGNVTTGFGRYDAARAAAIDRQGRIVAAGPPGEPEFGLARYRRNGELDRTFSGDGKTTISFGAYGGVHAVAIDPQGRIVAAGADAGGFALARYKPNGSLDPSFGGDGRVTTDFGLGDGASSVAIDSRGRIIAAGSVTGRGEGGDFALARYRPDGSLDPSFGVGGKVTTGFGGNDGAFSVAIDSGGRIVVAGFSVHGRFEDFALARFQPNGSLDFSFSSNGRVTTDFGRNDRANSAAIDSRGRIVAAGVRDTTDSPHPDRFALARYRPNGSLDGSLSRNGKVTTAFRGNDRANSVAIDSRGRIVAVGTTSHSLGSVNYDFALARYRRDGRLDRSFSGNGKATTDFGRNDQAEAVVVDPQDRIVAAGVGRSDFALARYIGYRRR